MNEYIDKIQIDGVLYLIGREAAAKGVINSLNRDTTSTDLPTAKAVVDFIIDLTGGLNGLTGAMHFRGSVTAVPSLVEAYSNYISGDVILGPNHKEYVFLKNEDAAHSQWIELGDEGNTKIEDLGALAYKDTGTYLLVSAININTATVTSTGKFTPEGIVSINDTTSTYIKMNTTTNEPISNTANYWLIKPEGTVSITYTTVSNSAEVITEIDAKTVVTSITTDNPTSVTIPNSLAYAEVNNHNLQLRHLVASTDTAVEISNTAYAYISTTTTSADCEFLGTTIYAISLNIVIPTSVTFNGTEGNISVASTENFVTDVTMTTTASNITFD